MHIHQLSISRGGVPKLPVPSARVGYLGIEGDGHDDVKHHGGPDRAVCLFSLEVISKLNDEGHPIAPGTTGDNITVAGVDWSAVVPGSRFVFERGVELETTQYTTPCSGIRDSFTGMKINRIKQDDHPGWSRVYARVVRAGTLSRGETFGFIPAPAGHNPALLSAGAAQRFAQAWYAAWNARDLDAIMALYAEEIEHSSPFIARYNADPSCAPLKGKAAVRDYFGRALQRNPTLAFNPMHIGVGVNTVNLVYRRMSGDLAVEVFFFNGQGLIARSISHYEVA